MFLVNLFLFKRGAPLIYGFLRFAVILFAAVLFALWIITAWGCSSTGSPKEQGHRISELEMRAAKNAMFRKHNTGTTQALRSLGDTLSGPPGTQRSSVQVRHE